jgi:hypothetical protein
MDGALLMADATLIVLCIASIFNSIGVYIALRR